ncbi:hypothetical protein [Streptomyces sp. NPDC046727]|uniref:hypothetical protein n=1 Tax=Streptomyces sp. NPDC046727 TaxID=3155373 RepID=UPI0033F45976
MRAGLVDTLERDGLARRVQNQRDRRSVRVRIAPAGRERLDAFRQPTRRAMSAVFRTGFLIRPPEHPTPTGSPVRETVKVYSELYGAPRLPVEFARGRPAGPVPRRGRVPPPPP